MLFVVFGRMLMVSDDGGWGECVYRFRYVIRSNASSNMFYWVEFLYVYHGWVFRPNEILFTRNNKSSMFKRHKRRGKIEKKELNSSLKVENQQKKNTSSDMAAKTYTTIKKVETKQREKKLYNVLSTQNTEIGTEREVKKQNKKWKRKTCHRCQIYSFVSDVSPLTLY